MENEYKMFNIAASLIRNAGYHADIVALDNGRLELQVQDPVHTIKGAMAVQTGLKTVKIHNCRGDSVLRGACRFVEERS